MELAVVIPTHRPDAVRLQRVLRALTDQTLPPTEWETILVDNASVPAVAPADFAAAAPDNLRVIREPNLGLSVARRRGFLSSCASQFVLVDDDNVLAPDYLAHVVRLFAAHPKVGVLGGKSRPEFSRATVGWQQEFFGLLALRDLGDVPQISEGLRPRGALRNEYPDCAPIGAGMGLRASVAQDWAAQTVPIPLTDRRGGDLSSGGDNDIVFTALRHGWQAAYFPELVLTHLIPSARLDPDYLARLNRGIQKSWMQVLTRHDANPWPAIPRWTLPLRQVRAWLHHRAWSSPAARIRWQGACGHFEGRSAP